MKSKEDAPTPDSANISGMLTNEDEEDRTESRERSRGKRRTAREIANMFEQLKQRHIARKREWQEEKEELLKRVQAADESKRVLAELKGILENLREELRLEERKRIKMEAEHFAEKRQWETERTELLKRLEESAHESDKDGNDIKRMAEKLAEQSRQLSEWQGTVLELKKQLLEKENKFLRDRRELHFELEKERSSWKKKEKELQDKIRQAENKSSESSTSPTLTDSVENKDFINMEDYVAGRIPSGSLSTTGEMNYSNFQRTVDDALKQIEKISTDLKEIDSPTRGSDSCFLQGLSDLSSPAPSPRPGQSTNQLKPVADLGPSPNAPWRTRRKSSSSNHTLSPENKSSPTMKSDSPVDASISLPSIKSAQMKMKLSPNPERKVRKISQQGSKVDIIVSSPDAPAQETEGTPESYFPFESGSNRATTSKGQTTQEPQNTSLNELSQRRKSSHEKSPVLSRQKKVDLGDYNFEQSIGSNSKTQHVYDKSERFNSRISSLAVKEDDSSRGGSASPRLPKLHQQLLFKREPSLPLDKLLQRSFESESIGSTDKGKTTDDEARANMSKAISSTKEKNPVKTHTPYFDPEVGYRTGSRTSNKRVDANTDRQKESLSPEMEITAASAIITPPSVQRKKEYVPAPPAVQPKPKVAIHKDEEGNIVGVSSAADRKSVSPESNHSSEYKYNSLGKMGKAGRDWIRKKLSFKDRKPDEQENELRSQGTPEYPKKKGKIKSRQRSSSLLKNKRDVLRSISSTEESSDGEGRKRESFLRRPRRKAKSPGNSKPCSPAKPKPRKYTRSKTEASPKDMKNFLSKFKASQSNPNKPSIVKQFEMKLLENEVKTLTEENVGRTIPRKQQTQKSQVRINPPSNAYREKDGYMSGEEGDEEVDPMSPIVDIREPFLPTFKDSKIIQDDAAIRNNSKRQSAVKPKTHFRKSMTDFRPSQTSSDYWGTDQPGGNVLQSKSTAAEDALELCEKKTVSKLVNRFSANLEDEGVLGVKKPIQQRPTRRSSLKHTASEKTNTEVPAIPRSNSLSSHDGNVRQARFPPSSRITADTIKETSGTASDIASGKRRSRGISWLDQVTAKPESDASEAGSIGSSMAPTRGRQFKTTQRISAPPGQFDSLSSFWENERSSNDRTRISASSTPGRVKMMSEEMKRKADVLEKALSKGPRKPRRYRRAETQPVHSNFGSSSEDTLSDTEDVLDLAFRPFSKDPIKTNGSNIDFDDNLEGATKMHAIIPPVTGKFNKPNKPGRLPSRWARS